MKRFGGIIARYQAEGKLRPSEPVLVVGALLGPVIINTMLRAAETNLPIPALNLTEHVTHFLRGYAL